MVSVLAGHVGAPAGIRVLLTSSPQLGCARRRAVGEVDHFNIAVAVAATDIDRLGTDTEHGTGAGWPLP